MPGSSFGQMFRVTTAGESHGPGNVVIVDGCPPGVPLDVSDLEAELARRKPGQSKLTTQRKEDDAPEILSGVYEGRTTGTPIAILVRNTGQRGRDYDALAELYRPGHADHTYDAKYGLRDPRGGGRASARETVARVAAGAIAKKVVAGAFGGRVVGWVSEVGDVVASVGGPEKVRLEDVEKNAVRCPDEAAALRMAALIDEVRKDRDSIGGVATICATGVPAGLGEPVFDKLKADLGKAILSIPAVLGVEYGGGFASARLRGSQNNDLFVPPALGEPEPLRTATNRHGGILGGISSGMPIVLRAAVKPTSSIAREQATVDRHGRPATIKVEGRHDPCVLPRFVPIAEAMVALVLVDHWLRWKAQGRAGA